MSKWGRVTAPFRLHVTMFAMRVDPQLVGFARAATVVGRLPFALRDLVIGVISLDCLFVGSALIRDACIEALVSGFMEILHARI
jgi:hypothetical protein